MRVREMSRRVAGGGGWDRVMRLKVRYWDARGMFDTFRLFRRLRDLEIESDACADLYATQFAEIFDELKGIKEKLAKMDAELVICGQCRLVLHVSGVVATGMRAVNGSGEEPVQFCRWCAQTLKSRGLLDK